MTRTRTEAYKIFFEAMKTGTIKSLCYAAWKFFEQPVLITDENYKLLCQYPRQTIGVDIWDTLYEAAVLPEDVIKEYQTMYLNTHTKTYKPFYANTGLVQSCPRIFGEIFTSDKIVGHVAIFMFDSPFQEEDLACVQVFIDALNMLMNTIQNQKKSSGLKSYFLDLLKSTTSKELSFFARTYLENHIKGNYAIMVTPVGSSASDRARSAMISSNISSAYKSVVSVAYEDNIVTLFGLIDGIAYREKEKTFFKSVVKRFGDADLISGISEPFHSLDEIQGRYQQAELTASLAKSPIVYFRDLFPQQLFEIIRRQVDFKYFIMPQLLEVHRYDEENGTEYFKTLREYTTSFHDKNRTAARLCIHRNTLHYRLTRIKDLFDIDIEDDVQSLELINSFQLLGMN